MISFKEFSFLPGYTKTRNDVYKEFYEPCMKNAVKYDRITGYFGSSVFVVISRALKEFILNDGKIRIICSPVLTEEDTQAIIEGYLTKEIEDKIAYSTNEILDELKTEYPNSTFLLSKLIASGHLEIRLAVFGDNPDAWRLVHDKAGVFIDKFDNKVAFRGSINETFRGLSPYGNSESFDVYTSWGETNDLYRLSQVVDQFNKMWEGKENKVTTFKIPDMTIEKIESLITNKDIDSLIDEVSGELNLIDKKIETEIQIIADYDELVVGETINLGFQFDKNIDRNELEWKVDNSKISKINAQGQLTAISNGEVEVTLTIKDRPNIYITKKFTVVKWGAEPGKNRRIIRPYQKEILENWEKNYRKGLFQMATGSGKTFTAMCAVRDAIYRRNEIPIIVVPRNILFDAWKEEIEKVFGDDVFLLQCGNGYRITSELNLMTNPIGMKRCILTTIQTASKDKFLNNIYQGKHLFLLIDEVHNVGAKTFSRILNLDVGARIGLSATPKRYGDPEGTEKIFNYFGGIIEPTYSLEDAINDGTLCEYYYYPSVVDLTFEEQEDYQLLTQEISQRYSILKSLDYSEKEIFEDSRIKILLIKRSDIIKKAHGKIDLTYQIIKEKYKMGDRWLIYCDDNEQLQIIKKRVEELDIPLTEIYEYHSQYDQRSEVLKYFEKTGGIMFSINCLDEGVDIPSIDNVIILASSKNERQFIQRRGRALRKSQNKMFAYIYDAIVSPNEMFEYEDKYPFLLNELIRATIFAKNAKNSTVALSKIKILEIKNNNYEVGEFEDE